MAAVTIKHRLAAAPDFFVIRDVDSNDVVLPSEKSAGVNCAEFDEVVVMATLHGGATAATVEAVYWSDARDGSPNGGFVRDAVPSQVTVAADGARAVFRVGHHASVFFRVSGLTGGSGERLRIEVAGVPVYNRRG